jgi:hypothetical protein
MIEICLNVGLAQITNRFNATFLSDVDGYILEANESADRAGPAAAQPSSSSRTRSDT